MRLFDDFKNQIDANDAEKSDLPWEENLESSDDEQNSNKNMDIKKLAKIGICLLALILLGIALFNFLLNKGSVTIESDNDSAETSQKSQIQVHVAGQVKKPGVYKLDYGSRIMDAVNAAGGFSEKANRSSLNLAKVLEDGEQILIESTDSKQAETSTSSENSSNNGKVNINTADITQLQSLSGVGPATAQKIIDYRTANGKFKNIEDLKKVSGIGEKTFAKFADKICV